MALQCFFSTVDRLITVGKKLLVILYDKHCLCRATPFATKGVALHTKGCSHPGQMV